MSTGSDRHDETALDHAAAYYEVARGEVPDRELRRTLAYRLRLAGLHWADAWEALLEGLERFAARLFRTRGDKT